MPRLLVTTPFLRLFSLPSCPLTWSPTESRSPSWFNADEAATAVDYVEQLLQFRRSRVTPEQIGVITPFAKQVATPTCNPVHRGLQPRAPRLATPCTQACNPVHPGLQPRTQRVAACDRAQPSPCRRRRSRRCFARAATCRRAVASRWAASRASRGRRALMRARGCSPTNARLQPYQSMHTCRPIRTSPLSVLYTRSARPSSSRRCARRWASSRITFPNP